MKSIKLHPVSVGSRIRYIPYSINSQNNMHWATKHKWKKAWEDEVYFSMMEHRSYFKKIPIPYLKLKIIYYNVQVMDEDNLRGSVKPILDGIVNAGVIYDDSPKYLSHTVEQVKVHKRKEQGVELIFDI